MGRLTTGQIRKQLYVKSTKTWSNPTWYPAHTFASYDSVPARRHKPAVTTLFSSGTALGHNSSETMDAEVTYDNPYSISIAPVSQHYPLGLNGNDNLRTISETQLLRNKLLSEAKGAGVNLANMLGEYRQSAKLFGDAARAFYLLTMAAHQRDPRILIYDFYSPRGRLRRGIPRRVARKLSSLYLQYMYGVKPLMNDVSNLIKQMKTRLERPVYHVVRARQPRNFSESSIVQSQMFGNVSCRLTDTGRRISTAVAHIELQNETLFEMLGKSGFTNPLSVAWELTPWSFVLDWWLSVGDFLSSLDNYLYFKSNALMIESYKYTGTRLVDVLGTGAFFQYTEYSRNLPVGLGTVASVLYKPSISLTHIANGSALLTQLAANKIGR